MKKRRLNWYNIIRYASGLVLIITAIVLTVVSCQRTQAAEVEEEPTEATTEATTEIQLDCFKYVEDIPLPEEFQTYINKVAKSYEIAPEIVFAMIERESNFDNTEIGDGGDSEGLMQIQKQHHEERMARLGVTDLFDPYGNVLVGVDYLAELLTDYEGNLEMALTAYNAGPSGAYEYYFSHGIEANEYAETVIENSKKIEEGMVLVFYKSGDPVADFTRYDAEQQKELEKLPVCSHCDEPIQDDYLCDIDGTIYCLECFDENFIKATEDYTK